MSVELKGQVNSFLKRAFKCGFCRKLYTIEAITMPTQTYFVKWLGLIPVIVFTLSFLLLNLVTIISDPKDIHMHYPDVTLRSIKSHLSHVASLSIYNVFKSFFYVRFYHCMCVYCIHFSVSSVTCRFVTCYIKYQSINKLRLTSTVIGGEMWCRRNVQFPCRRRSVWQANGPLGELSSRRNVQWAKCPVTVRKPTGTPDLLIGRSLSLSAG